MNDYEKEYDKIKKNPDRVEKFRKSGEDGLRIFPVLNSNIKTLETICKYVEDMYSVINYDSSLKHKNKRVQEFNFRSLDNHLDTVAINRSDILIKAKTKFLEYDNAFVGLLLYILLLDTGDTSTNIIVERARDVIEKLPIFIKRNIYSYAKEIVASGKLLTENIYQQIVILYGDQALFSEFLNFIIAEYPDEDKITKFFVGEAKDSTSPIAKRIDNFQASALKKDAFYLIIFYSLDQYVSKCKMKGLRTGRVIVNAKGFLFEYLDYLENIFEGSYLWLGKVVHGQDMEMLKDFIENDLSEEQREVIYSCISKAFELNTPEEGE